MARRVMFRKKKQNRMGMIMVAFIVIIFCSIIGYKTQELKHKRDDYNNKIIALQGQIDFEKQRSLDLAEYEKYTKTSKYVEEVAKDKLGLVYADEIVFESGVEN